jgi:hypothetical protein
MYDEKTCMCDEAAWLIVAKTENGVEIAFFECHATEDQDSPNGVGWYFASHMKDRNGNWAEHDGGMYWDYENATDLRSVIGESVPFMELQSILIDYNDFEEICFGGDKDREKMLLDKLGFLIHEVAQPEKAYNVKITETLERTVSVKASNRDEALDKVKSSYKNETHVLDADDFKDVSFKVIGYDRGRNAAR